MKEIASIDYMADYEVLKPSLWYESPNVDRLIESIFKPIDIQQQELAGLANNLLDLDNATGSQLDFIGMLVGQPRFLIGFNTEVRFGFEHSYQSETFGSTLSAVIGGYWNSRSYFDTAIAKTLDDETYRRVIKARSIFNNSNCGINDLVEVTNLLVGDKKSTVQLKGHGILNIKTSDPTGLIDYFYSRVELLDNILPVPAGVKVILENLSDTGEESGIEIFGNALEKLVNEDLPESAEKLGLITISPTLEELVNEKLPK